MESEKNKLTIEQIYEKAYDEEYDNIFVRDIEMQLHNELEKVIEDKLLSLGFKHLEEENVRQFRFFESADMFTVYEAMVDDGKTRVVINIKSPFPEVKRYNLEGNMWIENIWD